MKRTLTLALMGALLIPQVVGCSTFQNPANKLDPTKIAMAYYRQDRTYEPVQISGLAKVTLEAAEGETLDIILSSQLEPLSIYPREPNALREAMEGLWKIGTVVGSTIVGAELVQGLSNAPKVVEPTIVKVPVE